MKTTSAQLDLLPAAPRTRIGKRCGATAGIPRVKFDKSQKKGAKNLKVEVVTEELKVVTLEGDEVWEVIRIHAVYHGATAHAAADKFISLMAKGGLTPMPANVCAADGAKLKCKGDRDAFIPCLFPEPVSGDLRGGGRKSATLTRKSTSGSACPGAEGRGKPRRKPAQAGKRRAVANHQ